jgi:hypothetical protein
MPTYKSKAEERRVAEYHRIRDYYAREAKIAVAEWAVVEAAIDAWANRNADDSLDYQFKCDAACAALAALRKQAS